MRRSLTGLTILSSLLCVTSACSPQRSGSSGDSAAMEVTSEALSAADLFKLLPSEIQERLDSSLADSYARYLSVRGHGIHRSIEEQLQARPDRLPVIPNFALPLQHVSHYDGLRSTFHVLAPKRWQQADHVVLLLGDPEDHEPFLRQDWHGWRVSIPSRPHLNYRLVAEGDLWASIDELKELYPMISKLPVYIVGTDAAADAGLYIANNYRHRFAGLAINGSSSIIAWDNLDHFPVIAFGDAKRSEHHVWTGQHVVARLQKRNNPVADLTESQDLAKVIEMLCQRNASGKALAKYRFEDYRYSQVYPWLRVVAKRSEYEPCTVAAKVDGNTLHLEGDNIASVEIDRSNECAFPNGINQIRFAERLYTLQQSKSKLTIGEDLIGTQWKQKTRTPSGLQNFYRSERLLIVYQDDASSEYRDTARRLAGKFSTLQLKGLPQLDVNLPLLKLSEYDPSQHTDHRAIIIGQEESLKSLLEKSTGYFPFTLKDKELHLGYKKVDFPLNDYDQRVYSLIYPPEQESPLKLAMLLVADDVDGLTCLGRHYSNATALYSRFDMKLWVRQYARYLFAAQHVFDSYWGYSHMSPTAVVIPEQTHETWTTFLQDFVLAHSGTPSMILRPLNNTQLNAPTQLSYEKLEQYINDRQLVRLNLSGREGATIANKILNTLPQATTVGLDEYLADSPTVQLSEELLENQKLTVIVDAFALELLPAEERLKLDYEALPFSLMEMVMNRVHEDPKAFGRDILRTSAFIADHPQSRTFR